MWTGVLVLLIFDSVNGILSNRSNDFVDFMITQPHPGDYLQDSNKCTTKLHHSLEKLRKRQANLKSAAYIDLSGYALHQTLRNLPLDMYVTDIRVKTPAVGDWVRIQKCQFSNRENRMTAQILFNDLTVSGTVQLLDDNEVLKNYHHPIPRELCKMSLRLQRAGLGINAFPTRGRSRGIDVRTEARFMDPKFLSVHAYGCKLNDILRRSEGVDETEEHPGEAETLISNDKHVESRLPYTANNSEYSGSRWTSSDLNSETTSKEKISREENAFEDKEVRIITLNPDIRPKGDSKWYNLHSEEESSEDLSDFHRQRILSTRLHVPTERDKLKAVLHIQKLIAQQANQIFQAQGPFSNNPKPLFKPFPQTFHHPLPLARPGVISTITELDENLSPIRPVPQRPFETLFAQGEQIINNPSNPNFQNYFEEISREMEDIFLRGIKTLLTKYVEKQLEIPLKEALMVNYGYTVSYG